MTEKVEGFDRAKPREYRDKIVGYLNKPIDKGVSVGHYCVDNYYRMKLGTCTDWTGYQGSGKTEFLLECLLNTAQSQGWIHMVYLPDAGDSESITRSLIEKYSFKSFDPDYNNLPTEQEIDEAIDFIDRHFIIVNKNDVKLNLSPIQLWDWAALAAKKFGVKTVTLDSWFDLHHDFGNIREDWYLRRTLSYRNHVAAVNNIHIHTVAHPRTPILGKDGKYPIPDAHNISGGSNWAYAGKNMITIYREDYESGNDVDIVIKKIKPKECGNVGSLKMYYDVSRSRYYCVGLDGKRSYAFNKSIDVSESPLAINDSFDSEQHDIPF